MAKGFDKNGFGSPFLFGIQYLVVGELRSNPHYVFWHSTDGGVHFNFNGWTQADHFLSLILILVGEDHMKFVLLLSPVVLKYATGILEIKGIKLFRTMAYVDQQHPAFEPLCFRGFMEIFSYFGK